MNKWNEKLVEMAVKFYVSVEVFKMFPTDEHLDVVSDCIYNLLTEYRNTFGYEGHFLSHGMLTITTNLYDYEIEVEDDIPIDFFPFFSRNFGKHFPNVTLIG